MKQTGLIAVLGAAMVLTAALSAAAAPNIYGESGLIETPDDSVYPMGSLTPSYHVVFDIRDTKEDINFYTVGVGILPNLSVSGGVVSNGDSESIVNAKYRIAPESVERPSIAVGIIDAAENLSTDPTLYVVFGKNLTAAAEEFAGGESKPLRGYIGFGTEALGGLFVGLEWSLTGKMSAMLEYVSSDEGLFGDAHFNGGIRYALTDDLVIDAVALDFKDFTAGISYKALKF